jgi:NAD+ diphosphatase
MIPGFTGSTLDRTDIARHDAARLAALRADPRASLLRWREYLPELEDDGRLGWDPLPAALPAEQLALLGVDAGGPRFLHLDPAASASRRSADLFALVQAMAPGEAATYAAARSLLDWHARHRFCACCGAPTAPARAGWARLCPQCGTEHYPRTDPVVIMLAQHGRGASARVLVGRQPSFPPRRYSALAGFVEVGEALEEAVRRELKEEAGVAATTVRFLASQPWPFPSQLMLACVADVADDRLIVDRSELEDALWVSRAEVRAALAGDPAARFDPPPAYAIARTLFEAWLADDGPDQPTKARSIT